MVLLAVDTSHWQTVTVGSLAADIWIQKATQYNNYVDPTFTARLSAARTANKPFGVYHFAGPTVTPAQPPADPVVEANWFLAHYSHQAGEVIVLDWEALKPPADPDGWCATWCSRVFAVTGVTPMVYMNSSTARSSTWAKTRALGCALWVAQYGANTGVPGTAPAVGSWGQYAMWQYTSNGKIAGCSSPCDLSQFYGDVNAWHTYGSPQEVDVSLTAEEHAWLEDAMRRIQQIHINGFAPLVDITKNPPPSWAAGGNLTWLDKKVADAVAKVQSGITVSYTMSDQDKADIANQVFTLIAQHMQNTPGA